MVAGSTFSVPQDFSDALDDLLYGVCEQLQLSDARYDLAVGRYNTLNKVLESAESPFRYFRPEIYPQGSMALGTTVKPIDGSPHDLDFVLQLSRDHNAVDPMDLIETLYQFLHQHAIYGSMTERKNRCVRIEYADDFYMDVLPACLNLAVSGTCVKIPDCSAQGWADSNPLGYIAWFKGRTRVLKVQRIFDSAAPIPPQQAVGDKETLKLAVQLFKRWRDLYYAKGDPKLAPISIVLTTLAADTYKGERSVSKALESILRGIIRLIDESRRKGEKRLRVENFSNPAEDLSERWDSNQAAYAAFEKGIRAFGDRWSRLLVRDGGVDGELKELFGEPVATVLKKRASQFQELRSKGKLGISPSGAIATVSAAIIPARPNTFYGKE
jgi:hypothetical protein